jgi:lipopolysaccharide transport system ATP-binding protein
MEPILEISNVSKKYLISHQRKGYLSLRERILDTFRFKSSGVEDFWALSNVTFNVLPGDSIGIIGRNGAGKSTLLKILSKITPPTSGKIKLRGRIGSLLEVGTGFHPELTGRENIFFNGSLLGMKRNEIVSQFDEIVDFSGVEKFLDTQLKHYSSGMQLRLAFAVAAFLQPEILVIDEVLAVGDAEFQKKCIGKMEDVTRSGRTIVFVSHNMQAIANLCNKAVVLKAGQVQFYNTAHKAIDFYNQQESSSDGLSQKIKSIIADKDFRLLDIRLYQNSKHVTEFVVNGSDLQLSVDYEILNPITDFRILLDLSDQLGTTVLRSFQDEQTIPRSTVQPGRYVSTVTIPADLLAPISYDIKIQFGIHNIRMLSPLDGISMRINVEQTGNYNKGYHGQYTAGVVCPTFNWITQRN